MGRFLKLNNKRLLSFTGEIFDCKFFSSQPSSSSLQKVADLNEESKSVAHPFFNLLPETQNPNNIVNLIYSALKSKDTANSGFPLLQRKIQEQGPLTHLGTQEISRVLLRCQSDSQSALIFFNWVKYDMGLQLSTPNYCFIIHVLVWSRKFSQAMRILSELVELNKGLSKNDDIFKTLLLCSNDCNWDPVVFDMLMKAYLKLEMVKESFRVFKKMTKLGFVPQVITVNCLLAAISKSNYCKKCWEIYEVMKRIGVHPNTCTFNILVYVVCRDESVDKVNKFVEKMEEEEGFDPDIVTYNMLIHNYCREGRLKDAIYLYNIMFRRGIQADIVTYTYLIDGLCKRGSLKTAHLLFSEMIQRGVKPHVIAFNKLISGYCREGLMQEARSLLQDMIGNGLRADDFTCRTLVKGYQKKNHLISAVNLVMELLRFRFTMHGDVYDSLIIALCEERRSFAAKRLVEELTAEGNYQPNADVYCNLIDSFCDENYVEEGLVYKAEMESKDMELNLGIYRAIICSLCRLSRLGEAEKFTREMVTSGMVPDNEICRSLVSGYCKERNMPKAVSTLQKFAQEFQVFDTVSYNELCKVICSENGVDKVMELQDSLKQVGFVPNGQTCKYVIDELMKAAHIA